MTRSSILRTTGALLAVLSMTGCIQPLDVGSQDHTSSGGTGGSGATTGDGGTTVTTGDGGTGAPSCTPGEEASCFDGPAGSSGVGVCQSGTHTCNADGHSFGACLGQVLPDFDVCDFGDEVDSNCDGSNACAAPKGWSIALDPSTEVLSITATAVGPDHSLFLAGTRPFPDESHTTCFLMKVSPQGAVEWTRDYDSLDATISGLAVTSTGDLLVAGSVGDHVDFGAAVLSDDDFEPQGAGSGYVGKLDSTGTAVWMKTFETKYQHGTTVHLAGDGAGNAVIFGKFIDSIDFGGAVLTSDGGISPTAGYVTKVSPDGELLFANKLSASPAPDAWFLAGSVMVDGKGGILVSGEFRGDLDAGGAEKLHAALLLPAKHFSASFLAKYTANGDFVWQKGLDGPEIDSIAMSPEGEVMASGPIWVDWDFGGGLLEATLFPGVQFYTRWNENGEHVQSKTARGGPYIQMFGLSLRSDGVATAAVVFSGGIDLTALDGPVAAPQGLGWDLLRFGPDDQIRWHLDFEGPNSQDFPVRLIPVDDRAGGVFLWGSYTKPVDFGFGPLPGTSGLFVARLVP